MKYCFGIDVGGTSVKAGLFEENGTLKECWSFPTRKGGNGALIYDDAAENIRDRMASLGLKKEDISGVGLDFPAPVHEDGSIGLGTNIETYGGYPGREVSSRLGGIRTVAMNDANAAGLGEMWMGAAKGYRSAFMVTLGTGVGGALIIDGKAVTGRHGAAGEIGHLCLEREEQEKCNCGGRGCTEFYASATGIVRVARRMAVSGDPMVPVDKKNARMKNPGSRLAGFGDELTAKDVCDLAKKGDAVALKALEFSMEHLARALSYVMYTADPDIFVIGGGVSAAGGIVTGMIRDRLYDYTPMIRKKECIIVPAVLGNRAGMYGAAKQVLDSCN